LLRVDPAEWRDELPSIREHLATFGTQLPDELRRQLEALEARLNA
jgi:phosphoenolpyruvate carboxykinase (GTP)